MTLKKYLSQTKLYEMTTNERDSAVKKTFGFTDQDLKDIRKRTNSYEHLIGVAEAIYEKTNDPIALTKVNISAVGSDQWEGEKTVYKYSAKFSYWFKEERNKILSETLVDVPYTHLLRKQVHAYFGNLEETAPLWEVQPSSVDFLRSVKLPESLKLGYETSQILGILWADAYHRKYGRVRKNIISMESRFGEKDVDLYDEFVIPNMEKIFNINKDANERKREPITYDVNGRSAKFKEFNDYVLIIGSQAVIQMLLNINFPVNEHKRDVELPKFLTHNEKKKSEFGYNEEGFLEGIIAGMGDIPAKKNIDSYYVLINDKDEGFIHEISDLSESLRFPTSGVSCSQNSRSGYYYTRIGRRGGREVTDLSLINPRHQNKTI